MRRLSEEAIGALVDLAAKQELAANKVVEYAKDENSPLHTFFEWDDSIAGHKYRIEQARKLIASVRLEIEVEDRVLRTPRFVHNPDAGNNQGYEDVATLRLEDDKTRARKVIRTEVGRAVANLHRANEVADALDLRQEMEALIVQATAVVDSIGEARE